MIISSKLGIREPIYLVILCVIDEAMEVILKHFGLPICFWMVRSRELNKLGPIALTIALPESAHEC